MNALTTMSGLEPLGLTEGQTLAVTGGAGLLASYVIGIAKRRGLRVLADAKPEDEELVRGFGADVRAPAWRRVGRGHARLLPAAWMRCTTRGTVHAQRVGQGVRGGRSNSSPSEAGTATTSRRASMSTPSTLDGRRAHRLAGGGPCARLPQRAGAHVAETSPPERAGDAQRRLEAGGLRGLAVIVFPEGAAECDDAFAGRRSKARNPGPARREPRGTAARRGRRGPGAGRRRRAGARRGVR